jgi:hypothetical protein
METILIIVVLVLMFGGGGRYFVAAEDIGDRTRSCSGVSRDAKATSPIRIATFLEIVARYYIAHE